MPREWALLAYALFKLGLAAATTYWVTRGSWPSVLAVLTCLPLVNDVAPGNFMVPIAAAMALAVFGEPRRRSGIAVGFLAAAVAKPVLVPFLLWMLVFRRKAAEGAIATGAISTVLAAAFVGPATYLAWIQNLFQATRTISSWDGNYGVSNYLPQLAVPIAFAILILTVIVVARADENRALGWVLAAGILVSPYAGPLEALPLLLALPLMKAWPRVYALVLFQPLAAISVALLGVVALVAAPLAIVPKPQADQVVVVETAGLEHAARHGTVRNLRQRGAVAFVRGARGVVRGLARGFVRLSQRS
jgi:hypothetical protein